MPDSRGHLVLPTQSDDRVSRSSGLSHSECFVPGRGSWVPIYDDPQGERAQSKDGVRSYTEEVIN